ncbi:MAG: ribosome maturation factor RimM [Rickettsiales bacterium]|jgi:16S rRNA processing protein RimM|nr:ribosome maturation factor RimM [Rickettsiales bacterium]
MEMDNANRILVGKIVAPHGLKGEVKIRSFTTDPAALRGYAPLFDAGGREFVISLRGAPKDGIVIAAVDGMSGREAAEALRGTELYADRAKVSPGGTALLSDLPGLEVVGKDGKHIGRVEDTLDYGAGDILEVAVDGREKTALMLLSPDGVLEINMDKGYVKIDADYLLES